MMKRKKLLVSCSSPFKQINKEGSAASPTKVAFALDDNPNMLISEMIAVCAIWKTPL
jgi:hypothetical protein